MDYTKGYTASFKMCFVDPNTFADIEWAGRDFDGDVIVSGSINRTTDSLRNSASIVLRDYSALVDKWIRIYMDTSQNGSKDRTALFTGLATSPELSYRDGVYDASVDCYSVLKPAEDIILSRGYYVSAGENGVRRIVDLLNAVKAPVRYQDGAFDNKNAEVKYSIVAEDNETNLSMIEKILNVIGWRMQVFGDGTVYISEWPYDPTKKVIKNLSEIFSPFSNNVVETSFTVRRDWFNCPNVFKAVYNDYIGIAKDEDEESILSIPSRGREIWMVEDAASLDENESIASYAYRRLKEEQSRAREISYSRRYLPGLYPDDIIQLNYEEIKGTFYIDSQTITLGHAAVTNEQLSEVI